MAAVMTVGLATGSMAVLPASVAQAATDLVTNCSGSAAVSGSLPYEVAHAASGDFIEFSLSPPCSTITVSSTIALTEDLSIQGPGTAVLAVSGGGAVPVFAVASGISVDIDALTITDGQSGGDGGALANAGDGVLSLHDSVVSNSTSASVGGAIYNNGTLLLTDSTVTGNSASLYGGAVYNGGGGIVSVTNSTVADNTAAQFGGGFLNDGTLTVTNSTLTGNSSGQGGGALEMPSTATSTITSSTVTDNSASFGAGLDNDVGTLSVGSTIVADNGSGGDCGGGLTTDQGYNLSDDNSCAFTAGTDLPDTPAGLDPSGLENNGGPTQTIAIEPGSAAIDEVNDNSLCPSTDQRGAPRTVPCDIGAYDTDLGPAVVLDVSGTQKPGGSPSFTYSPDTPDGVISGTLSCTTVDGGTPISSSLAVGIYLLDTASCSGLTSSDPTAYPIFQSSYTGTFVVSAAPAWTISPSPDQGTGANDVDHVTCTSATFCVSVGDEVNGSTDDTMIESWNGSTWSIVSSPDQGGGNNKLSGVYCTSPTRCEAVGSYVSGSVEQTLIESWNGTSWSIVSSPNSGAGDNQFIGVTCTVSTFCEAVGEETSGSVNDTLIESWNGASWSIVSSPDPSSTSNQLVGVSCTSATFCEAVGNDTIVSVDETLVESWSGSSWSTVSSPDPGGKTNLLDAVSCISTTACTAVGNEGGSVVGGITLVEAWNGASWSVVSSPNHMNTLNYLDGVSCTTSDSCVAVGSYIPGSAFKTLIESWNGTSWSIVSSPDSGTGNNDLGSVSCISQITCVAVGYQVSGSTDQTLVEMPPPPIVSAVAPATGFTTGGGTATITGSGFTGATAVAFGPTPAVIDSESGDSSIVVTVPPGSSGPVDVVVTAPGGFSTVTAADVYTYTVDQTPITVPCQPNCTNTVSTPLNTTSVSVTGDSGTSNTGPSTSLVINTGTVSCGGSKTHNFDYATPVSTLSTTDFPADAALTVTEIVGNEPSTTGVKVCFGAGSNPTNGSFLHNCTPAMTAPCLQSLTESSGSVTATFLSPATDPRFWTGEAAVDLKSFAPTKGAPNSTVTIKGKNLTGVVAVVIGGSNASIQQNGSTASKLQVTVPSNARTGPITVTSAAGEAVSTKPFTVN